MSVVVVEHLRSVLLNAGVLEKHDNVEESGGPILIGYRGRLWRCDEDFNVDEPLAPFDAIGCGAVIALGAMSVTPKVAPRQRILGALKAAAQFSAGVRAPFTILEPQAKKAREERSRGGS